jgi:hypothetical protein
MTETELYMYDEGEFVNLNIQLFYPQGRTPVPTEEEGGWALEPVWMIQRYLLPLPGFEPWFIWPITYSLC